MALPTGLAAISEAEDRDYHTQLAAALPELGLPSSYTTATTGLLGIHATLQAAFWAYGLSFAPAENETGHINAHNRLHTYVNTLTRAYGPSASYTQPAGSTTVNPGSFTQALVTAAATGTKFWLTAGRHELDSSIALKTSQEVHCAPGATITGAKVLNPASFTASGADWFISGQSQRFTQTASTQGLSGFALYNNPEDLWFDGEWFEQVATQAELAPGKFFFDYTNSRIYLRDNPSGHTVETTSIAQAFTGSATGCKLQNAAVEKFGSAAQQGAIAHSNLTLVDCDVKECHGTGVANAALIQGCKLHHNGQNGVTGGNGTVEDTEIAWNNQAGYSPYWEAGTKWAFVTSLTVRRCWVHHNRGRGLWTDIQNSGVTYEDNLVEDNDAGGIFHEISFQAAIRRNLCRRNGQAHWTFWQWDRCGIELHNTEDVDAYNNSCHDNGGGSIIGYLAQSGWDHTRNDIHDNLLHTAPGYAGLNHDSGTFPTPAAYFTSKQNTYRLNSYRQPSGSLWWWWNGSAAVAMTLAQFQAQGQDTAATHTVTTPLFDWPGGFTDTFDGLNQQPWSGKYWRRAGNIGVTHERGLGRVQPAAGAFANIFVASRAKAVADSEALVKIRRDDALTQGSARLWLRANPDTLTSPTNAYLLELACNGATDDLYLNSIVGGSQSFITAVTTGLTHGTWYWIRWRAQGTSVRVRVWADGTGEPGTWNTDITNSAVTAAGRLMVSAENGAAGGQVDGRLDQLAYTLL